ncbi:MAG: TonB-dependent receptor, partial [Bacteroidales bacterium]|nr:TonB-dependent receptor [Bacteroidales bacterium]
DPGTPETDELFTSSNFMEINLKVAYTFELPRLDSSIELFSGTNNLTNNYQNNFDSGKNRDSGFIYGPAAPRSFFIGIRLFN